MTNLGKRSKAALARKQACWHTHRLAHTPAHLKDLP